MSVEAPHDIIERAIDRARRAGASAVDAIMIESDSVEARVRATEIEFVTQAKQRILGIRALVAGAKGARSATTSTSDLTPEAIDRMAAETAVLAKATAEDPTAGLPEEPFATEVSDLALFDPADRDVDVQTRIKDARAAEAAARDADPRIDNSEGSQIGSSFSHVAYGNSAGFFGEYDTAVHSLFSEPVAKSNGNLQRDYWYTIARRLSDLESPRSVGSRAAERALRRLDAKRVATCEAAVIFDPVTAPSLLGHLIGCINGYSVYRQTSYMADKLGETIATASMTVIDDGTRPGGLGSKPFDGEGLPTRRTVIVDRGRLSSFLLDSYSARKLAMKSTGSATRGAGSPPSAGSTNLWLEPGQQSLDEIIASTDRGLLVTELIGMGFNPITGDYSRGAAGLWIYS
ncbi:MAG: TldD/PmbA family protein [Deltaproteobacteria bacterium]|nr:TldD/PmbA family protein [Deltaproteobacteria bacterium]